MLSSIFTEGFHDRYLRPFHKLSDIINYIRHNPHRLLAIKQSPEFFKRINNIKINGSLWQAYGNLHLLDNPFKEAVIIHRSDSTQVRDAKINQWKHLAENGGVLVSPFISQPEKEIRRMCEDVQGKIILLTNKPFADREKPASHDFNLCAQDRLLILAPMTTLPAGRDTFIYLNFIAEAIPINFCEK
ncbi:MAG: hypothetical protein K2L93_04215 [Muribaculaceae bacterium]|nr:hypothetical protein [Muribaculaceae bacterium]